VRASDGVDKPPRERLMRNDDILLKLTLIIRRVFERDDLEVTDNTSAADVPGWDSFKMIEIIMDVEKEFSITISTRDMDEIRNVADFVLRISDKIASSRHRQT
jgi:acyl carrier protein